MCKHTILRSRANKNSSFVVFCCVQHLFSVNHGKVEIFGVPFACGCSLQINRKLRLVKRPATPEKNSNQKFAQASLGTAVNWYLGDHQRQCAPCRKCCLHCRGMTRMDTDGFVPTLTMSFLLCICETGRRYPTNVSLWNCLVPFLWRGGGRTSRVLDGSEALPLVNCLCFVTVMSLGNRATQIN